MHAGSFFSSIIAGTLLGYFADRWLGTDPWLTLVFLLLGIVSGFRNIYILTARELRRQLGAPPALLLSGGAAGIVAE